LAEICQLSYSSLERARLTIDSRTKVGSDVDTGPLTHSLNKTSTDSSVQVRSGVDEIHDIGGKVLSLPFDLGEHLSVLLLNDLDVGGSTTV
jgi:hypothetical protein